MPSRPTRCPTSTRTRSSPRSTTTRVTTCGSCSAPAPRRSTGDAPAELRETLKRFEPTARDAAQGHRPAAPRAARNIRRVITQLPGAGHRAGLQGPRAGGVRGLGQRQLRGDRRPGRATCARRCACCPDALDQTRDTLRTERSGRWPATSARRFSKLRPGARALAPSLRAGPPVPANHHARHPRPDAALRPRRRARPCATPSEAAEDLAVVTPRLTSTFKRAQLALQHAGLQPAAAARRATCSGPSWLSHAGASLWAQQDAHGPVRRGLVFIACTALTTCSRHDAARRRGRSWTC